MNHQDHDHYRRVIETSKEQNSLLCELRVLGRQVELWTTEASIIWVIMMLVMMLVLMVTVMLVMIVILVKQMVMW